MNNETQGAVRRRRQPGPNTQQQRWLGETQETHLESRCRIKIFARIMIPAGPEDVLETIRKWESRQGKSKYRRVSDGVQAGISRLQKFSHAISLVAQGSPAPGCLVWGSIIFVLTVSIP